MSDSQKDRIIERAKALAEAQMMQEQGAQVGFPAASTAWGEQQTWQKEVTTSEAPTISDKASANLVSMTFLSSREGEAPHIVTKWLGSDGEWVVQCTCMAMRAVYSRPDGCWGMKTFRQLAGIGEV